MQRKTSQKFSKSVLQVEQKLFDSWDIDSDHLHTRDQHLKTCKSI